MISFRTLLSALLLLLLAACGSTSGNIDAIRVDDPQELAEIEAEFEAKRVREEQLLAEDRAGEAAERDALARQTEEAEARQAEAEAQVERERQAQLQARASEAAAQEERARQAAAARAEERARVLAEQQARIAALRAQIAANTAETSAVEGSNAKLREAITAAENLTAALSREQEKYASADANGQPAEALSRDELDELGAELERLRAQAAVLGQQAP